MISGLILAAIVSRSVMDVTPGPNRLDPDAALLAGTSAPLRYAVTGDGEKRIFALQGGLDDLRFHDDAGNEIQYLLIAPPEHAPRWTSARSILSIPPTKASSGIEADFGSITAVDRIALNGLEPPLLKRAKVEASGDRIHWTLLAAETTIFDLPDQQLKNLEVGFAPGNYRYLRVVWDDRSSARVRHVGGVTARLSDLTPPPEGITIPLPFRPRLCEAGKSRYRLELPGRHLPIASIELRVTNANVFRDASVSEPRFNGSSLAPVNLGSARLRRAEADGAVAEEMTIPISFPEGTDLDLVVDDGNSGPLAIDAVVAQLAPLPWIFFESARGTAVIATYGDPSLHAPQYDLEASRRSIKEAHPTPARWSAAAVTAQREPAAAPLPIVGAIIDRKPFRRSRQIGALPPGLTSLVLDSEVLAHSSSLDDVRLVDPDGRQVPYLLESRDAPVAVTLRISPRSVSGTSSVYRFALPYERLPAGTRFVVTTTSRVFDRNVVLQRPADESHGREAEVIDGTEWRSSDPNADAPALTFTTSLAGSALELRIDDGDNTALPLRSAQLLLPSYALRFFSSAVPLTLLYDEPSATAPRYDLALLAPQLLNESAAEVALPPAPAASKGTANSEQTVFWAAFVAATLILLGTLVRLLKTGSET